MALTGMQIYKSLPRTNCKDCGFPTCMAFAMQVAAKQKELTACPHISDESKNNLSEASSPPMKLIKIGNGKKVFEIGQETVMFRHEEKFHRPTGLAIKIPYSQTLDEALKTVGKINDASFERVGDTLSVKLCAVELKGVADEPEKIRKIEESCNYPLILMGESASSIETSLNQIT